MDQKQSQQSGSTDSSVKPCQKLTDLVEFQEDLAPMTENERRLIDQFLLVSRIYDRVLRQAEAGLTVSLANYQHNRQFYRDLTDLIRFRQEFFRTIGAFLNKPVPMVYQLTLYDQISRRRRSYTLDQLPQINPRDLVRGTVVETLRYPTLKMAVRRTYTVQNHHLYCDQNEFLMVHQSLQWLDGLMTLKLSLDDYSYWLRANQISILAYT
ncbi:hypothetical protein FD37_GL002075 [Levilactobacillus spicheri DSM 15429]|uniref:Uncharacterized protein n=2 Tax=Levilactobacillus spicheri TaxID=216463 RepID=A0A0R1R6M2_9LACO|nr:hypothetical protein FD37_GL002075 [Levilactobacillus spicheri DSM 15429]